MLSQWPVSRLQFQYHNMSKSEFVHRDYENIHVNSNVLSVVCVFLVQQVFSWPSKQLICLAAPSEVASPRSMTIHKPIFEHVNAFLLTTTY